MHTIIEYYCLLSPSQASHSALHSGLHGVNEALERDRERERGRDKRVEGAQIPNR